ncbi:uncharacterized protein LOC108049451 [Drosophila rhopaloa]|uniref:Uncharacterized protein LOC108049451 n=1 Tax=Drosophila rhopaloa TaxID=1041015 RepID=A0A6P4FAK2_DRORH|nr:uncharacterized protein LOC108049451 [Drosophila rhopaloa]
MEKVRKSIKRESPSDEEFISKEDLEAEKPVQSGSSNEESDEETEEGRQDQKNVDDIISEMDEEKDKEQEAICVLDRNSEEYNRNMYELSLLSPAAMALQIQRLENELYELSQREARELTRSKHLRIFGNSRRRSNK